MGKKNRKKKILFLVEGPSDKNALEVVIPKLYASVDPDISVDFPTKIEDGREGGDITTRYGITPSNIEGCLNKLFIGPYLQNNYLYPRDIAQIIQIVDTDGIYIPDEMIHEDTACTDKILYREDGIWAASAKNVMIRNLRKMGNLNHLVRMENIKVGSRLIRYSVFYFSCNLDHYLHSDANLSPQLKCQMARDFSTLSSENMDHFLQKILTDPDAALNMSYKESWDFIKEGGNSLTRHTNITILLQRILTGR